MNTWFLYLIRCKHGRLYTGITTDIERRFEEHKSHDKKGSKYLRGKAPLKLVMKKKIGSKGMALKIRHEFHELTRKIQILTLSGQKAPRTGRNVM